MAIDFTPSPEADAIGRITDRAEPRLRNAFLRAVRAVRDEALLSFIEAALSRGDLRTALAAIPWTTVGNDALASDLLPPWRDAFESAGRVTTIAAGEALRTEAVPRGPATALQVPVFPPTPPSVPPPGSPGSPGAPGGPPRRFAFEVLNPRPLRFLEQHGAALVVEISEPTRLALRETLVEAARRGWDHRTTAKDLIRHIGLTQRLARANRNYRMALEEAGKQSAAMIDRRVAAHARRLLMYRGMVISRTEAKLATSAGQLVAIREMIDKRLIDPAVAVLIWETSEQENVCTVCAPMHRQMRTVAAFLAGDWFVAGDGRRVEGPGSTHPQCVCSRSLQPRGILTGRLSEVVRARVRQRLEGGVAA